MKATNRFLLILAALAVSAASSAAHASWPDNHLTQAWDWTNPNIDPANNVWGAPASITVDPDGTVHATTKCGSFMALLLEAAYPGVITEQVVKDLTNTTSTISYPPDALQWYTAIATERSSASGIRFHQRTSAGSILAGDILAAAYTTTGDTGHAMTVQSITPGTRTTLPADKAIPGVGAVNEYQVTVYDSTNSPHGAYASNPAPDTRYKYPLSDDGIGSGTIVIYEDAATGRIVAWAWNVSPTTSSYYYAFSFTPAGTYDVRPIVAGYLDGPGL